MTTAAADAAIAPEQLCTLAVQSLDDDKAEDVIVIDLAGKADFADFMIVASGRSTRQVSAMADKLCQRLKGAGIGGVQVEGAPQCDWVLLDAGDVIVHIFRPEVRTFYNLEKMWSGESPRLETAAPQLA